MFNKKEIAELQAQVKELQTQPSQEDAITDLSVRCTRMISAQQITITYQEERILKQDARIATLEKLVNRIIDYTGMKEGHLS